MSKTCDVLSEAYGFAPEEGEAQQIRDLADTLANPAGARVMARLLKTMGVGSELAVSEGNVALYNMGMALLSDMAIASPWQTRNILHELFCPLPDNEIE